MNGQENPRSSESLPPTEDVSSPSTASDAMTAAAQSAASPSLRRRVVRQLRRRLIAGKSLGGGAAADLGQAAEALALEVISTDLAGDRVLLGHVLGMHLTFPAGHLHGPRQAPTLLYLFADALAVRPTDDAPMSTVPMFGLHMVLPPVAVARWLYKAGRIEHANLDLVKDAARFASSLAYWTVDDFSEADPKLEVYRTSDLPGPLHVYEHLGFAHIVIPVQGGRPVHLRSSLPVSSEIFVRLWQLFSRVDWPHDLRTDIPTEE